MSLPKIKVNQFANVTLSVKNNLGFLQAGAPGEEPQRRQRCTEDRRPLPGPPSRPRAGRQHRRAAKDRGRWSRAPSSSA